MDDALIAVQFGDFVRYWGDSNGRKVFIMVVTKKGSQPLQFTDNTHNLYIY